MTIPAEGLPELSEDEKPRPLAAPGGARLTGPPGRTAREAQTELEQFPTSEHTQSGLTPLVEDDPPTSLQGAVTLAPAKKFNEPAAKFKLTGWILALTSFFTVGFSVLLTVLDDNTWERLQSQLGFLLTPFHTLLGIAIGYYFADKRRDHE